MDGFNHYVPPTTKIPFQSDKRYHVFLSFRGEDVRKTFVDHLYEALSSAGLCVFLDTYKLEKGDIIDGTLKEAIESSEICIPMFSKEYASSVWCLREATWMLNSTGFIIPLFYDVEPTHVRYPENDRSPYAQYFSKHYEKGRYQREEIDGWKQSLRKICDRSGWSKELTGGYEGQLVKKVTLDVINSLDRVPLDVAKHPVGLEDRKEDLIQRFMRLDHNSANAVIKLGILGIGGIGKTTLATAVYNEECHRFDGSSFLFNVRSTAEEASGLRKLQGRILQDLVKYDREVRSVAEGKALMRDRLGGVRAFVILDDVNAREQLEALLGDWMAPGSRILVTSRDRHILNLLNPPQISNQFIYEMSGVKENEALQLFSWHAFLRSSPDRQYEDVSNRIVRACQGHPLSLEVMGAFLYDKKNENDIECWNETLLNIGGREEIFKTLHISYSGLSHEEKQIFLDTACFFKGEKNTHHFVFWQSLGYKKVSSAISNLSMKLLLKIDDRGVFDMHDHLQEMGRTIVEKEFPGDAYHERSRVWEIDHACNLFNNNLRNQHISRLRLRGGYLPHTEVWNTPNLRLLHMQDTKMEAGRVKLPQNLIWLRLESCWLSEWKWNRWFSPKWGPCFIFDGHDWKLRFMELRGCTELKRLPSSIGNLSKLQSLTVSQCDKLKNLPDSLGNLSQLESLDVSRCRELQRLPSSIGNLSKLQSLTVSDCQKLENLPDSLGSLSQLESLDVSYCRELQTLPSSFGNLSKLQSLKLTASECQKSKNLPDILENFSYWMISSKSFADTFPRLISEDFMNLKSLLDTFGNLSQLTSLDLSYSTNLESLPDTFRNLSQLTSLDLSFCYKLERLPDTFGNLYQLTSLSLWFCGNLKSLPDTFGNLSKLKSLNLACCIRLENLPDTLGNLTHLKFLNLHRCSSLKNLPDSLSQLDSLDLWGWS